jgi:hypothetical protein
MKPIPILFLTFIIILLIHINTHAQRIQFDFTPGVSTVLPMTLSIHQKGEEVINTTARYKTESLVLPIYYSYRLCYSPKDSVSFELELNHLKIYLKNTPDEVQNFQVSHGYNQLFINYCKKKKNYSLRYGLGPVIAHPENTIRNKRLEEIGGFFNGGYHLSGIAAQLAVFHRWHITKWLYTTAEAKSTAAFARIRVFNGYSHVPVISFSALAGLGVDF